MHMRVQTRPHMWFSFGIGLHLGSCHGFCNANLGIVSVAEPKYIHTRTCSVQAYKHEEMDSFSMGSSDKNGHTTIRREFKNFYHFIKGGNDSMRFIFCF